MSVHESLHTSCSSPAVPALAGELTLPPSAQHTIPTPIRPVLSGKGGSVDSGSEGTPESQPDPTGRASPPPLPGGFGVSRILAHLLCSPGLAQHPCL